MTITALIPARKNSERFPGKNYTSFLEKPLFMHSVDFAKNSKLIDKFYVTTNDENITSICQEKNIPYLDRPDQYCMPTSSSSEFIEHFLDMQISKNEELPDALLILQPTDPIRENRFLEGMVKLYQLKNVDCVFTVVKSKTKLGRIKNNIFIPINYKFEQRFQDMEDLYQENGMFFLVKVSSFLKNKSVFGKTNAPYIIPEEYRNMDIDTELEMDIAELTYKKYLL